MFCTTIHLYRVELTCRKSTRLDVVALAKIFVAFVVASLNSPPQCRHGAEIQAVIGDVDFEGLVVSEGISRVCCWL